MYLYAFTLYAGHDRVFRYQGMEKKLNFSDGDLIQIQEQYFLVLGEHISFQEQYQNIPLMSGVVKIIHKHFITMPTLQLLHRMVHERYSTYKSVMKHFLPKDITTLLKKANIGKKNKKIAYTPYTITILGQQYTISDTGQTLIIFPDLWTLYNTLPDTFLDTLSSGKEKNIAILHSASTQNQKDKTWRGLKNGTLQILLTTHAQIFQDFSLLVDSIHIAPHKRYYANQQDPRYKTSIVVEKMKEYHTINKS